LQLPNRSEPGRGARRLGIVLCLAASLAAVPALADPIEDFYRGKQLTIVIRATPGGNYDSYSRLLARYLPKYIPGNPVAVPVNMPAGGGLVAFNHVMNVAPKDGTVITIITETFPMDQALGLNKSLAVDLRRINCVGNMSDSNQVLLTRQDSATQTLEDAKHPMNFYAGSGGGKPTITLPISSMRFFGDGSSPVQTCRSNFDNK